MGPSSVHPSARRSFSAQSRRGAEAETTQDRRANKKQIRNAIQIAFNVSVVSVNTMNVRGKKRRSARGLATHAPSWKKAIITLVDGDTIQIFEGV